MTWTLESNDTIPLWRPIAEKSQAILAFSTRRGGVSEPPYDTMNLGRSTEDRPEAVAENRRRLLESLELDPAVLATAGQVHGDTVSEALEPGLHPNCDVLLTRRPGLALAVTTADCLPLLLVAPGIVAAVHSGWRGTAAGAPTTALRAVREAAGVTPDQVLVHIGPGIRSCCYRVGSEVAERFPEAATKRIEGQWHLDLAVAARLQLCEAGVPEKSIADVAACTYCQPSWYFSHRRDRGRTGRHWAIAALRG
jgi:YfiH family protein